MTNQRKNLLHSTTIEKVYERNQISNNTVLFYTRNPASVMINEYVAQNRILKKYVEEYFRLFEKLPKIQKFRTDLLVEYYLVFENEEEKYVWQLNQ